ncbi:MAG: tetrathionate reductase family octaheme c-type cytochrome [Melioribacteraceae bacterium]|nr:tetrathionate reductase family octaheme c-type cytochrome [Melioribacteraceae bacterium]
MRKILLALTFLAIIIITAISVMKSDIYYPPKVVDLKEKYSAAEKPTVDHSKFAILDQHFDKPQDVTEACVTCHNTRDQEIMQSSHWNWERPEYIEGRGIVYLGKKNAVNNFCIGTQTNEQACAKCHIGFGMSEEGFTFTDKANIDCMVCHDNSGTYIKAQNKSGYPDPALNLNEIAQHIGKPTRDNCGVCHFFGGGGNNVKHGDLEMSMFTPDRSIDVHMAVEGANLVCVDCHTTENHQMKGKIYSLSSMNVNRSTCEQCHTETPHEDNILNEHTIKVACQTCHIPTYAKANSTKMYWDWSTAGKLKDGKPYTEEDSLGNHTYMSIKGSFEWGNNLTPDYVWFNGTADHYLLGDEIKDTTKPLVLNQLHGAYGDFNSKIIPVKIHKAKQIYDPVNKLLIQPHLWDEKKGEGAYWVDFNWNEASEYGMSRIGLPYSGEYDFIETEMYWPINHMVAPKEESISCESCHSRENSRLANLTDFYMPGRDYNSYVDFFGKLIIILTLLGVLTHGAIRIFIAKKNNKAGN